MQKNENLHKHDWGYEIIWASNDDYCGKILVFEKNNQKTNLHFHKKKTKSWFVNAGMFKVQWVDTKTGKIFSKELLEGSTFTVPALMPVMLENLKPNSAMAEVSTTDDDEDFYRLN